MSARLLTIDELADFLQVPKATLYRWRYHGEGPPGLRLGRHVRYRQADVDAWLADQPHKGAAATSQRQRVRVT